MLLNDTLLSPYELLVPFLFCAQESHSQAGSADMCKFTWGPAHIASATSGELQSELQHNVSDPYRTCILVYFVWVPICLLVHCVVFNSSTRSLLWIKSHQRHVCITCVRALLQGTGGPRSPEVPCINVYPNSIPFKATVCINQPSALF